MNTSVEVWLVVIAIAPAAHRWLDARLPEPIGVPDADVLTSPCPNDASRHGPLAGVRTTLARAHGAQSGWLGDGPTTLAKKIHHQRVISNFRAYTLVLWRDVAPLQAPKSVRF